MLKLILCSGLYPQLAIPDDFNKYKARPTEIFIAETYISIYNRLEINSLFSFIAMQGDADQMFHTRSKGFTILHPMGIFANQPDVLRLNDSDIIEAPHLKTKLPISAK